MTDFSPPTSPEVVITCEVETTTSPSMQVINLVAFILSDLLVCGHDYFDPYFFIAFLQESTLDTRTSTAVESLLSLRSSVEEWRPPSPASSTTSESLSSPPRLVREEISSPAAREGSAGEAPVSSSGTLNVVSGGVVILLFTYYVSVTFCYAAYGFGFARAARRTYCRVVSDDSSFSFHSQLYLVTWCPLSSRQWAAVLHQSPSMDKPSPLARLSS